MGYRCSDSDIVTVVTVVQTSWTDETMEQCTFTLTLTLSLSLSVPCSCPLSRDDMSMTALLYCTGLPEGVRRIRQHRPLSLSRPLARFHARSLSVSLFILFLSIALTHANTYHTKRDHHDMYVTIFHTALHCTYRPYRHIYWPTPLSLRSPCSS